MTLNGMVQLAVFFLAVVLLTKPIGLYMLRLFNGEKLLLSRLLAPVERLIYRICRVNDREEQHWTTYTGAMLLFSLISMLVLYGMERLQFYLPFNPQH